MTERKIFMISRFSQSERELVERAKAFIGDPSFSAFLRMSVLENARKILSSQKENRSTNEE